MEKSANDQSNDNLQTSKPSGSSNPVLNILRRFRSKKPDVMDREPDFDERLGAANGPLAERVSEISTLIEAGRKRAAEQADPSGEQAPPPAETTGPVDAGLTSDDETTVEARDDAAADGAEEPAQDAGAPSKPKSRVRAMGFHNPVFSPGPPEAPKDPDFKASTEPPEYKAHDAPDGVMENSGAPEKRVTPAKARTAEPLDLKIFSEHVRSSLPKQDPEANGGADEAAEPDRTDDADAFKKQFFARLSRASNASLLDASATDNMRGNLELPPAMTRLSDRKVAARNALQSWQDFQSSREPAPAKDAVQDTIPEDTPPHDTSVATEPDSAPVEPAAETAALPEGPDTIAEAASRASAMPEFEPQTDNGESAPMEINSDITDTDAQAEARDAQADPAPAPRAASDRPAETPEPDPAADDDVPDPVDAAPDPAAAAEEAPENVFAALEIDEDELLAKVYDLIQTELQSAWGENITLNIRKIVRDEVRAAMLKARSDSDL